MSILTGKLGTIDKIIFIVLMAFTLFGVALTNMSPADAHKYWLAMILVFTIAGVATGWQRTGDKKEKTHFILTQAFHWGSALVAVLVVYAFLDAGQIKNETASLVILVILALSAFLDGLQTGWHFFVVGVLLAITAVVIAYIDEFIWIIAAIAIVLVIGAFYWNKYREKLSG